jgi:hypothetical protein
MQEVELIYIVTLWWVGVTVLCHSSIRNYLENYILMVAIQRFFVGLCFGY